jgi:hypothetical protein
MVDYQPTVWTTGDIITASLLNHGETQYDTARVEAELGNWTIPASAIGSGVFSIDRFPSGTKQLFLDAGSGTPQLTNGCSSQVQKESSTNKMNYVTVDFDHIVAEYIQWRILLPDSYTGFPFIANFVWTAESGSGNVRWGIQMCCIGNDDPIDSAWGTAVEVNDTLTAAYDLHTTEDTGNITPAGTPAGGKFLFVRVYRDATDTVNDTLPVDAQLLGVKLELTMEYSD